MLAPEAPAVPPFSLWTARWKRAGFNCRPRQVVPLPTRMPVFYLSPRAFSFPVCVPNANLLDPQAVLSRLVALLGPRGYHRGSRVRDTCAPWRGQRTLGY